MPVEQRSLRRAKRTPKRKRPIVTRAEFDRVISILKERGEILNNILRTLDVQFKRIAQMQAELDALRRTSDTSSTRKRR